MEPRDTTETKPHGEGASTEIRRAAFEAHFAELLGAAAVGGATLDASYGAERALELVAIARRPGVKERLALLPAALFPTDEVERLEALAHATLYADELATRQPGGEDGGVEDAVLEEAEPVRATLHKLLDYHFGDDPAVAGELQDLRARRGAFRVAATLSRLAALARAREAVLSQDGKYWRDDLVAEAERIAREVRQRIGAISEKDATELKRKAYGLMESAFVEVRAGLMFVMRHALATIEPLPVLKRPAARKPKGDAASAASA